MYSKPILFSCILYACFLADLQAQILNVEKARLNADSSNYFVGSIGFAFNANNRSINDDGETVSFVGLNANSDFGYISEHHSYLLLSQFNYTATSDDPINSTGYGHLRINFLRNSALSYETFAQIQYDQGRGMEVRWLAGGGIRYRFVSQEKINMYIGVGGMYEEEVWNFPGPVEAQRSIGIWKTSNYVSARIRFNEYVDLNLITYYQTGYDFSRDFFRHRMNADINLKVDIVRRLAFTTSLFGAYENRPVVPVDKFVYSVANGIIFSF